MRRPNFYSGLGFDRADHLRTDEAWLTAQLNDPATRFVAVWRSRNLVAAEGAARAVWLDGRQATLLRERTEYQAFLGLNGGQAYIALDLSGIEAPELRSVCRYALRKSSSDRKIHRNEPRQTRSLPRLRPGFPADAAHGSHSRRPPQARVLVALSLTSILVRG